MAKTLHISGNVYTAGGGNNISTANTTQYWSTTGAINVQTTETQVEVPIRTAGTYTNFGIRLSANTVNNTTVFTMRKNTADTSQTISVPTTQTGWFEDTSNSTSLTAGNTVCMKSVPASGSTGTFTCNVISNTYDTTNTATDSRTRVSLTGPITTTTGASTNYYFTLGGCFDANNTTEANYQTKMHQTGTLTNLAVNVSANARTATTLRTRKNSANGNMSVSITASTTGWFEDTSNTDSVAANDLVNYNILTGTGTSAITIRTISVEFKSTTDPGLGLYVASSTTVYGIPEPASHYFTIAGRPNANTVESCTQLKVKDAYTFKSLSVYIFSNNVPNTVFKLRVNGADTSLAISSITGTGWFQDNTNTVTVAANDLVNFIMTTPATSGSNTIQPKTMLVYSQIASSSPPAFIDMTQVSIQDIIKPRPSPVIITP